MDAELAGEGRREVLNGPIEFRKKRGVWKARRGRGQVQQRAATVVMLATQEAEVEADDILAIRKEDVKRVLEGEEGRNWRDTWWSSDSIQGTGNTRGPDPELKTSARRRVCR